MTNGIVGRQLDALIDHPLVRGIDDADVRLDRQGRLAPLLIRPQEDGGTIGSGPTRHTPGGGGHWLFVDVSVVPE